MIKNMETSLKTGFAQIFSCCPKNLSCPNFGGAAAPLASPARTPMPSSNCKKLLRQICRFVELLKYSKLIWTFCKEKLKRYKIFRIALGIVKNNENGWVSWVINHRVEKNLGSGKYLWWRYDHPRVALTIFPDQYSGKVNVVSPNHGTPCIFNGERCISGEIHTASIGSSWRKENLKELLL